MLRGRQAHPSARALLTLSGALVLCACGAAPPSAPHPMLGQAVSFALPSDDGKVVSLPLPGSRATVLDFFSPTCVPCKDRVPALYAARDDLAGKGGRLVLVAVLADSETTDDARRALASWGVRAPFLVDREGASQREVGVRALPATMVLDRKGVVRWVAPLDAPVSAVSAALP